MNPSHNPPDIDRIVIVLPSWVGDSVMATPILRAIRQVFQKAHLAGIMRPGLAEVLAGNPWLDETITCHMKGIGGVWRTAKAIRSTKPDAVLLLPNSFRSALATRLSGAPMRIGYNRDGRGWLLTHSINVEKSAEPTPTIDYYAHLVRTALGVEDIDLRMELFVTPADSSAADKILHDVKDPFVLLNPGGNTGGKPGGNKLLKRWPVERFALLADHLASTYGMVTVLSGAPGERDILEAVMEQVSPQTPLVNLVDRDLNLGNLKAIVQRAALMITNDTGPRHIAAALGTPLITLFGPTDHRWTTINYPNERIILAQPFLPEKQIADQHAATCRIDRISVSDVAARVKELLTIDN